MSDHHLLTPEGVQAIARAAWRQGLIAHPAPPDSLWAILVSVEEGFSAPIDEKFDVLGVPVRACCISLGDPACPFTAAYKAELRGHLERTKGYPILVVVTDGQDEVKGFLDLEPRWTAPGKGQA